MYPAYAAIREEMSAAAYGKDYKEMEQRTSVQDAINNYCVHIILINPILITGSAASGLCSSTA